MRKIAVIPMLVIALAGGLTGCVIAPAAPPVPVAYYPMPAPGYIWVRHSHHGWGWHHPHRGWHRGWR
jgi:hypothetical protein